MRTRQTARACASLFRIRFAEGLQYRAAALSGTVVGVFWALVECVVFTVYFTHGTPGTSTNGMTLAMTISYVWLAQAMFPMQSMSIDGDILRMIQSGDVGVELCRPLSLYWHWYVKAAAGKLGTQWMRMVATVVVGLLMPLAYAMGAPASPAALLCFALSLLAAFLLCSSYAMLVTAVRLNITWGDGPTYMMMLISGVLSGSYLPLRLWPDALQVFLRFQPFGGFTDIPIQLYLGLIPPAQALPMIGLQIAWSLVFILIGRLVMRKRLGAIIIQGG